MSANTSIHHSNSERDHLFLHIKVGMTVIITNYDSWFMANVIYIDGGARDPKTPTMFQVANVDTGEICWINADLVTHLVSSTWL